MRIQRWRRLMQNRQVHTRESFIKAQLDTVSFTARALLPLIAGDLWFTGEAAPNGTPASLVITGVQAACDGLSSQGLPGQAACWCKAS